MCRSIKTLFNYEPPATDDEIRAASLQFVRKLSGFTAPSKANEAAFNDSVDEIFQVARRLVDSLTTTSHPRNRIEEAAKARARVGRAVRPRARSYCCIDARTRSRVKNSSINAGYGA